ncbi:MAG TPA: ParM/StbA family protein, partial [Anaerolineae bacterium]|nr:ParM/StbA family protein [Anaerolineae bacterium]
QPAIIASDGSPVLAERAGLAAGIVVGERPTRVTTHGRVYWVGPTAHAWGRPLENLDESRLTGGAPEMEALLGAALSQAATLPERVHLAVGLPLSTLQDDAIEATLSAARAWLTGAHQWRVERGDTTYELETTITGVTFTAQPIAALLDYLLDDAGQYRPERRGLAKAEIGVISLGMNTVELLVIQALKIVQRFSAGHTLGVRRLLDLCNPGSLYSRGELDARLRAGTLDIAAALPVWESEVRGEIEQRWGSAWRRFQRILIVGGGAHLLRDLPLRFEGRAVVSEQPVQSIARGLWKLAERGNGA